jgi:hypothetical protein
MAQFLTNLVTECIDDTAAGGRGFWKVLEPFTYQSDVLGKTITVEPGFITDYASVPRLPLTYFLFGDTTHKAAVIHDWLFHHHEVCDEDTANKVLLEAAKAEGIPNWRRIGIYLGVEIGGDTPWAEDGKGNGHTIVDGKIV